MEFFKKSFDMEHFKIVKRFSWIRNVAGAKYVLWTAITLWKLQYLYIRKRLISVNQYKYIYIHVERFWCKYQATLSKQTGIAFVSLVVSGTKFFIPKISTWYLLYDCIPMWYTFDTESIEMFAFNPLLPVIFLPIAFSIDLFPFIFVQRSTKSANNKQ